MSGPNLKSEVSPNSLLNGGLRGFSITSPLGILFSLNDVPVSGVFGRLIKLLFFEGVHGFFFSFKDRKFNPEVFSGIPKVFQEDISLSGVLLVSPNFRIDVDVQLLALTNFGIPIGFWSSPSPGMIVYNKINSATSP